MEISDNLACLYSAQVEQRDGRYVIEVPETEVSVGDVAPGDVYRIALLATDEAGDDEGTASQPRSRSGSQDQSSSRNGTRADQGPPVDEGERRTVDIEDIGEKGDGIARVERGYVVIVPDTEQGERVTIEITDVKENLGFAEVVERKAYYE
ncbi:Predicted RNA-binding protein, contains TRAM domain [Halomicrobium zhouii]|uniref:Predicted RNA-binding protein, contains TRAM domain n=1 Tax=Halomicrobium zhouii TaxID=767519 RepID=A0A1I6LWD8_9EURY|nr:TRAM domain-containing protein [Halomicrobium zhouii]SFS07759.1 Predicted RNA-binding protein, contains TRAM domain [Halomicrobium zhouii]